MNSPLPDLQSLLAPRAVPARRAIFQVQHRVQHVQPHSELSDSSICDQPPCASPSWRSRTPPLYLPTASLRAPAHDPGSKARTHSFGAHDRNDDRRHVVRLLAALAGRTAESPVDGRHMEAGLVLLDVPARVLVRLASGRRCKGLIAQYWSVGSGGRVESSARTLGLLPRSDCFFGPPFLSALFPTDRRAHV